MGRSGRAGQARKAPAEGRSSSGQPNPGEPRGAGHAGGHRGPAEGHSNRGGSGSCNLRWWLLALVGAHVYGDVVSVLLQANELILKLINAVGERGISTVVVVQLVPQALHHGYEASKPLHKSVLSLI